MYRVISFRPCCFLTFMKEEYGTISPSSFWTNRLARSSGMRRNSGQAWTYTL